jgi:hypothetical protein
MLFLGGQVRVSLILSSTTYIGKLEFNGETLHGNHPPIIDADPWDGGRAIRSGSHRRGGRQADGGHLLVRGMLRRPERGSAMVSRNDRPDVERERYVCQGRTRPASRRGLGHRVVPPGISLYDESPARSPGERGRSGAPPMWPASADRQRPSGGEPGGRVRGVLGALLDLPQ